MRRYNVFLFIVISLFANHTFGGAVIKKLAGATDAEKLFTTEIDEKKDVLKSLQEELAILKKKVEDFDKNVKMRLAEIATQINVIKSKIKKDPQNEEFLSSKLSTLNDLYQTLKDIQQAHRQIVDLVSDHIKMLQEYLEDPNFAGYLKEYSTEGRSIYLFEDLQTLNRMELGQKKLIASLSQQEKNSNAELESRTKSAAAVLDALKKKKEELKEFSQSTEPEKKIPEAMFGFNIQQRTELLSFQEKLAIEKNELAQLRLSATKHKVDQIKTKLFVEKSRLDILKAVLQRVEMLVKVRDEDVAVARAELNKKKQQSLAIRNKLQRDAELLGRENERRMQELQKIGKKYNIVIDEKLDDWSLEPQQTSQSYIGLCVAGHLNSQHILVERERELLEARRALETEKFRYEEIQINIKNSFYGIGAKRFASADAVGEEVKAYDAPSADISATISRFKERKNALSGLLEVQKRARDNIKNLSESIQKKRSTVFAGRSKDYSQCIYLLRESLARVQKQIDVTEKTLAVYRDVVTTSEDAVEQIKFILGKLRTTEFWQRSEYAIKWEDAKNVFPDVRQFFNNLRSSVTSFSFWSFAEKVQGAFSWPADFLWLFFKLLILFGILFLFRVYVQMRLYKLVAYLKEVKGFSLFSFLVRAILDFVMHYYFAISLWIVLFALLRFGVFPDQTIHILFYLFSIPYFIYIANRFLSRFMAFNVSQNYAILTKQFQKRFVAIISVLLYSTIAIQLFRYALGLTIPLGSQSPVILLHLNFIILQVCLIFLITKEQILSLIPDRTDLSKRIRAEVDKFFYGILALIIAVIIMSHPGVGFGRQVLYVLSRLIMTGVLIPVLYWAQEMLKKVASKVFFVLEDDLAKERFTSSKSWYGLFVIVTFLVLFSAGFIIGVRIWGWHIALSEIYEWLSMGREVSVISLSTVFVFVIAGFLLASAFNRFVLKKIFDLLLVDMGVQHAVVGVTRYLIIIALSVIGLQSVGLGPLTKWLLGIVLAVGWVVKEPLGDLVAYFILLIQRPLKIGDYVQIDEKTFGVVRKITPRSIIIRQKNSNTIVVPNGQVLSKAVSNWNYVSGFVALDDISVNVLYKENPDRVIEILTAAVDSHTNVLKSPKPIVRLENFGEFSFVFLVRGFVSSHYTLDKWNIASDVRLLLVRELRKNGIDVAVPVRLNVSLKNKSGVVRQRLVAQEPEEEGDE